MKTYRQREKQGTKVSDTNKGPDEAKIKVRTNPDIQKVGSDLMIWTKCVNAESILLSVKI